MSELDDINDLMAFLDLEEDAVPLQMPQLRPIAARRSERPAADENTPVKAHSINDHMALMKLAVESEISTEERMRDIASSLQRDQQNTVHYRLPTELALSNLQ